LPRVLDYDWIVIGSGFGGSVAALRLAQKGYRVVVLEAGRRFADADFARSSWDARRYLWAPALGCRGILRLTVTRGAVILSGVGVGGGSLGYANALIRPLPRFYRAPGWPPGRDWEEALRPHFETALRMLGATSVPGSDPGADALARVAADLGPAASHVPAQVGVYFGTSGRHEDDPFFEGKGPTRTGCIACGQCLTGCRHGAKNTLVKNYLHLAEARGADIVANCTVTDVTPLDSASGASGYLVTHRESGALRGRTATLTCRGVVVAAGALGTNKLLADCRDRGSLPRLSGRIGDGVRTNSETILAVSAADSDATFARRVTLSSALHTRDGMQVQSLVYGRGGGVGRAAFTRLTRRSARARWNRWSDRTLFLLAMHPDDTAMRFRLRRRGFLPAGLKVRNDPHSPMPGRLAAAEDIASRVASHIDGTVQRSVFEAVLGIPTTAHLLGGAVIAASPADGVVDEQCHAFGYERLLVADAAVLPANPGSNPALTITAIAERAMAAIPNANEK
jgi:cholesterol oxidase